MDSVLCLMYHRINPIEDPLYQMTVSPDYFEQHIRYIKEHFACRRFEEEWKQDDKPTIVITFDDGYADNYLYALPILEKYQVPATIFVTTGNIGTKKEFWWDELGRLFLCGEEYPFEFTLEDTIYHYTWQTDTIDKRIELAKTLRWLLRMNPQIDIRNQWFQQIRDWARVSDDGRMGNYSMTSEQLIKMNHSEMITIGGHTVNHLSLGAMDKVQQRKEIYNSIIDIKSWTGDVPTVFSYPFGTELDFNMDTIEILRELEIQKAATTSSQLWNCTCDQYKIPRKSVKNWNIDIFKEKIIEFWRD